MALNLDSFFKQKNLIKDIKTVNKIIFKDLGDDYLASKIKPLINAKSKRLRPVLMLQVGQNLSDKNRLMRAAAAIEMLHISSLVHDDIMDEANQRRAVPTINYLYGNEQAILAGDYLFTKSFLKAIAIDSKITAILMETFIKLCLGQSQELNDAFNLNRTKKQYLESISNKTAMLFAGSMEIAVNLSDYPKKDIQKFKDYGLYFGLMFQIIDDLADYYSSPKILSKPTFNDLKEGNYSLPIILALKKDKKTTTKLINKKKFDKNLLIKHLNKTGSQNETFKLAVKYMLKAQNSLTNINSINADLKELIDFPKKYLKWSIKELFLEEYQKSFQKLLEGLDKGI